MPKSVSRLIFAVAALFCATTPIFAQTRPGLTDEQEAARWALENELQSIAIVERKLMIPMRDGISIPVDIYRPRDTSKQYPAIWVRTPYNFNFWDVNNGVPRNMSAELRSVKRGYVHINMQERGHFFAEGNWGILGPPITDGYDELEWITSQSWSNGKVGTTGCSSTAEWQPAVASLGHPGFAAMNVQGFGAGVGRVGPYYEQGNWYRGGAVQMLFIGWLFSEQNQVRPMFPRDATQEELIQGAKLFDLAPRGPSVDWSRAYWHLPLQDIMMAQDGPRGIFADAMPVATGGAMITRTPNDPAWYRGGLWHDNMPLNVPGLWFISWFDVSVGPNIEMYNHVRSTAAGDVADQQWVVLAPTTHCGFRRTDTGADGALVGPMEYIAGERNLGDVRFNYQEIMFQFFDRFLKGEGGEMLDTLPKVHYFTMGSNEWQSADTWPPEGAEPMTFYLSSGGHANTLTGDGMLTMSPPGTDQPDSFTYDPMNPVMSHGGSAWPTGSVDQREMEKRPDILVYTSEPFREGTEVSGSIVPTLYVSSDARDTDFTVRVIDVYPNGPAYSLDESIQRMRYREGYDQPPVWMQPGEVYEVTLQPLVTSNFFDVGHSLRIEVSSSNFPRFDRNLNTGGNNYDETEGVVAHNVVHHSAQYPSKITITV
ncbi:MAG: CocE/NonD family hydrolase, partial [Candidatus Latescibacteria bacterium]|nr:CocE/NonD family hydrolase [Candidatus Latescibacterota bacterium]